MGANCHLMVSPAPATWVCAPQFPGASGQAAQSKYCDYALAYRTQPGNIEIGEQFTVEPALCQKDGAAAPDSVRIDAHMPEHRHGMNDRTNVTGGNGKYRAEGLMFHMPGRWQFEFEVDSGKTSERVLHDFMLR